MTYQFDPILGTGRDGKVTLAEQQTGFNNGTAAQKAAFQSSVSGEGALLRMPGWSGAYRQAWPTGSARKYQCWPNKIRYDAPRSQFVVLYNANNDHIASTGSAVYCRLMSENGAAFGEPITVIDLSASSIYVECNGFVILPSGDYLAYVVTRTGNNGGGPLTTRVMRSTNGGASWSQMGVLTGSGTQVTPYLVAHAEYCASANRIFIMYYSVTTQNTILIKINPATPNTYENATDTVSVSRAAIGNPTYMGEGRFIDLGASGIVCISRWNIDADYGTARRAAWSLTTDGGVTWSAWAYSTPSSGADMNNGNLDYIKNADGTFDLYFSSRLNTLDGYGSLMYSPRVTAAELAAGQIAATRAYRVHRLAGTRDGGYPGCAENIAGTRRIVMWYDGTPHGTGIYSLDASPIPAI